MKKRNELKSQFLSRFQIITFNEFTKEELLEICEGMSTDKKKFIDNIEVIKDLIDFHLLWIKESIEKNDVVYYTLREINLFIQALTDKDNQLTPYEIILIIYGSKFSENNLIKLKNILKTFKSFKDINENEENLTQNEIEFENCQINKSLLRAVKSIDFAFKYGKNVIILGKQGVGKTQLGLWMANKYDKKNGLKDEDIYICICNEILKCSDLIGKFKPVDDFTNSIGELIKWQNGFVVEGILKGKCIILDNIEKALPTVTERLNNLLDANYFYKEEYFEIPENPLVKKIEIKKNFRILATVDEDGLNRMSPAFINRFMIVYLDDQLQHMDKNEIISLSKILLNKNECESKDKIKSEKKIKKEEEENNEEEFEPNFLDEDEDSNSPNNNLIIESEDVEDISNHIFEYYNENKENNNINLNIYNISKLCRILRILYIKFGKEFKDDYLEISIFLSFSKKRKMELNNSFVEKIIIEESFFQENFENNENYFYSESDELRTHICIEGNTGIGKTASAKALSSILKKN